MSKVICEIFLRVLFDFKVVVILDQECVCIWKGGDLNSNKNDNVCHDVAEKIRCLDAGVQ